MKLTAAQVKSITKPGKYHDRDGLILRVAPGGSKQWVWRGTVHGRRRELGLGSVRFTSLAEAREIAFDYLRTARRGGDPRTLRSGSGVPTFAEAAEMVIEARRDGWRDDRTAYIWRSSLERFAYPVIGRMPVDTITTADLLRVLQPIWHAKRETAKKVANRLGVVLRWSIAEGHRTDDPSGPALTAALPRNGSKPVEHLPSLPADQLGPALARLSASKRAWPVTIAALRFIAATACRSGEARNATWDEIDLDAATWTIPAKRTKTQRPHIVPLSAMALDALEAARSYSGGSGLIFESPTGRALTTEALSKFTRPERFTPHGVRASFRSWCAEQGIAREVAEAALAHTAGAVERAYQRSDLLEARRRIMADWAAVLATPSACRSTSRPHTRRSAARHGTAALSPTLRG